MLNTPRVTKGLVKGILKWLDIFLIHDSIISYFNSLISNIIPSSAWDHKPIAINFGESESLDLSPFTTPLWINFEKFRTLVARAWEESINGFPSFFWESKLKNVKKSLKEWVWLHYKEPQQRKEQMQKKLENIQKIMVEDEVTKEDQLREK